MEPVLPALSVSAAGNATTSAVSAAGTDGQTGALALSYDSEDNHFEDNDSEYDEKGAKKEKYATLLIHL